MFSTINSVKEYTNYDVSLDLIKRAQAIVEIFIGRDEIDIENPSDLLLLDKMTSYQSAYMLENEDLVFKQIASNSINTSGASQNFNTNMMAPYMAPLAVMASHGLSFKRSHSVKTGKIFQAMPKVLWRNN